MKTLQDSIWSPTRIKICSNMGWREPTSACDVTCTGYRGTAVLTRASHTQWFEVISRCTFLRFIRTRPFCHQFSDSREEAAWFVLRRNEPMTDLWASRDRTSSQMRQMHPSVSGCKMMPLGPPKGLVFQGQEMAIKHAFKRWTVLHLPLLEN